MDDRNFDDILPARISKRKAGSNLFIETKAGVNRHASADKTDWDVTYLDGYIVNDYVLNLHFNV